MLLSRERQGTGGQGQLGSYDDPMVMRLMGVCVCVRVCGRAPRAHQIMFDMAETTRIDNKVNFTLSCQPQQQQQQ